MRAVSPALRIDLAVGTAAGVVALLVRLPGLGTPSMLVFDEIYYADDALHLVTEGTEPVGVHPPLGKVLIALGIRVFGFTPQGWRAAALVFGIASVVVTAVLARRMSESVLIGLAAGVVVTVDGAAFTMGRLAMLDGLVVLPIIAGIGILLGSRNPDGETRPARAAAAGAVLGAACAVKWSAIPVLAVAALVIGWKARHWRSGAGAVALGGLLIATAAIVYTATYAARTLAPPAGRSCEATEQCEPTSSNRLALPVTEAVRMARFHSELEVKNSYAGPIWRWWTSPTTLWEEPCRAGSPVAPCDDASSGTVATIASVPSPVTALVALGGGLLMLARRRRPDPEAGLLLAALVALLAPWAIGGRLGYSYYLVSAVPVAVTLAMSATRNTQPTTRQLIGLTVIGCSLAMFLLQRPMLVGLPR